MAVTFHIGNTINGTSTGTPSMSLAFPSAVTAGDTLVMALLFGVTGNSALTIADTVNGTWANSFLYDNCDGGGGKALFIGYFQNSAAGTPTVTATWTGGGSNTARMAIMAYSGAAAASVDQYTTHLTQTGVTNPSTNNVTTTQASEMLVAIGTADNAGYTWTSNASGSNPTSWTNRYNVATGKLIVDEASVSSTGTYGETWTTTSDNHAAAILTLKAAGAAPAGPAFVKGNTADTNATSTGTLAIAFPSAVTAGNTLVLTAAWQNQRSGLTVSDSVNGAWIAQVVPNSATNTTGMIAYFQNTGAGTPTVTVSGGGNADVVRAAIMEYGGVSASSVDQISVANQTAQSNTQTPTVTTTQASELLIAFCSTNTALTGNASGSNPSSGWTNRYTVSNWVWVDEVSVSSTGSYKENWTSSFTGFTTGILTLKATGAAAPPTGDTASTLAGPVVAVTLQ
jgi:hypothetical protein